jgi:hypothetical protein
MLYNESLGKSSLMRFYRPRKNGMSKLSYGDSEDDAEGQIAGKEHAALIQKLEHHSGMHLDYPEKEWHFFISNGKCKCRKGL